MSAIRLISRSLLIAVCICASAHAADKTAEKKIEKKPVTVIFKKDNAKEKLVDFRIGIEDRGLFGTSFSELDKLPVKTDKLKMKVPLKNLAKIEIVSVKSVKKDGKKTTEIVLKLTATDKEPLTAQLDSDKPIAWKATHPFADSEVTLELDKIKAIILVPEK
jgi:hypothetical protein